MNPESMSVLVWSSFAGLMPLTNDVESVENDLGPVF